MKPGDLNEKGHWVSYEIAAKRCHQMNEELIRRWNERVKPDDFVYHVGDFCFKNSNESRGEGTRTKALEYCNRLNGQKIFIKGNHDKNNSMQTIMKSCIVNRWGTDFNLCHSPSDADQNYEVNFVGHVHEKWVFKKYKNTKLINVGVDCWNFYPKLFEELLAALKKYEKNNELTEYVPYVRPEQEMPND